MNTSRRLSLSVASLLLAVGASPVEAQQIPTQIVRDGTVGAGASLQPLRSPSGIYEIGEICGARGGRNLFHSFSQFTLGQGDTALFTADLPTDNVISRITGGPSSVYGTIRSTIPGASLWFLNPAGIFFGATASLDVRGSFHVSTADVLRMRDQNGQEFFAFSPDSLLRTATPVAFGFLTNHPAPLEIEGSTLAVPKGARFNVVGGDVTIRGATLTARGGTIAVASVASPGEAALTSTGLDTASFNALGSLEISSNSRLNASEFISEGAGRVAIRAGRFVLDSSKITADVDQSSGGTIDIDVRDDLQLSNGAQVRSLTDDTGDAASIRVAAGTIDISGGSKIDSSTAGTGKASDITVNATRSIAISDTDPNGNPFSTGIGSDVTIGAAGAGGDITIAAPSLTLQRGVISAETIGLGAEFATLGRPGNIRIQTNDLEMSDQALVTNGSRTFDPGAPDAAREIRVTPLDPQQQSAINLTGFGTNIQGTATDSTQGGASITLDATNLSLSGGAGIWTTVIGGTADAGKIAITAGRLSLQGDSSIKSEAQIDFGQLQFPSGRAGEITIQATDSVSLERNGADFQPQISTTTFGQGNGGSISVAVHNNSSSGTVSIDNGDIESDNLSPFNGVSGGHVSVDADIVRVENGGLIQSVAYAGTAGPAGQVTVAAGKSLTLQGSDPVYGPSAISTSTLGGGPAGNVFLSSPHILVADGASVDSFTNGPGNGGNIQIGRTAQVPIDTQELVLQGGGKVVVSTIGAGAGDAGSVEVDVGRLTLEQGGRIVANTILGSDGAGGSISVRASESATLSGSDPNNPRQAARIEASTNGNGDAGKIVVDTPELAIEDGARIIAASNATAVEAGAAGSISLSADQLTLANGVISAFAVQGPAEGQPREGNINIVSGQQVLLQKGSAITAGVQNGLGGDITIGGSNQMVMRDSSQVLATTAIGTGGRIQVGSDVFIKTADSVVSADAGVGTPGVVNITAPEVDLQGSLAAPPPSFLSASALLRPLCAARAANKQEGRFVVAQHRGLPSSPEDLLQAFDVPAVAPTAGSPAETGGGETIQVAKRSAADGASAFRGGRFEEAGERWAQAQAVYAQIGDRGARSDALRGLAQSQQALGRHAQSVETLREALALAEESKDQVRVASTLGSLGNAYLALGQTAAAEKDFNRGVAIASNLGENELQASLLNNIGNLHASQQAYDQAVAAYEQSGQFAHRSGKALNEAKAWANAARTAIEGGQANRGATLLERALTTLEGLPEGYEKAQLRIHAAKSFERLAHLAPERRNESLLAAHAALNAAVASARQTGNARLLSYALGNLSALYHSEYRDAEAMYLVREALRAAEQIDAPELLYRWRWQEGQILWAQGLAGPAIESYRRAVEFLEETRQEALSRYGAAEVYFRQGVAPVYLDLVRALLDASKMSMDAATSHQLLLEARETVEHLKAAELRNYFRDECVADLQARTASPESVAGRVAVVYPILLPDRLELLVTLPAGLERYTVAVTSAAITTAAASFRRALGQPRSQDYLDPAQSLYRWLVEPYAERLSREQIETIVFVPDGPLRTIPMAALHDGKSFLVEKYSLVVTPGLALVDPRPMPREKPRLLVAGLSQAVQGQIALPSVESELAAVCKIYGVEPLLNEQFTTQHLERQLADGRPSMVHIASHARFTGDAETSFILTYDGQVTMDGLSRMVGVAKFRDDPLELLVLSACETAAGDQRAALGLAGVALRAGARSVVGSLWPISDMATSELIARFYEALKDPTVSRGEALRRAQQALLRSRAYRHPFYWSPFLIIGNWL
jgi:filamentous hemagglutinin family protein